MTRRHLAGFTRWLIAGLILLGAAGLGGLLAWQVALHDQKQETMLVATMVLDRAGATVEQMQRGFAELVAQDGGEPCSLRSIQRMRRFDVGSSLLQGFGYVSGTRLMCSSFFSDDRIDIGQPDYVSALGARVYRDRDLPLAPGIPLLIIQSQAGYVAFVHPALLFLVAGSADTASGVVGKSSRLPVVASAPMALDWSGVDLAAGQGTAWMQGHLVAWIASPRWDHFAYSAMPAAAVQQAAWRLARVLVPAGVLLGLLGLLLAHRLEQSRASLPVLLRGGLRRGEVFLLYQPIVDLATGRWAGAEALARWRRPNGELVPPDIFVSIAERHGLIGALTDHVIATAVEEMAPFLRRHPGAFISLNISSMDLVRSDLVDLLGRLARQERLPRGTLHIEITERELVDPVSSAAAIEGLRALGFMVGSDDFGVGYSNLAYLDSLRLDFLKIDRAFVANAFAGAARTEIVDHIVALARSRDLQMVAEGVETATQRDALRQRGVHFAQGWLFARPLPAGDFRDGFTAQLAANEDAAA